MTTNNHKFIGSDQELWQAVLGQLQTQMTRATFDTWVKGTQIVSRHNGQIVVGTKNPYAKDWLENRLYQTIQRTVISVVGHSIEIQFVVDEELSHQSDDPPPQTQVSELLPVDRPTFLDNETNGTGKAKKTNGASRTAAKPSKPVVPPNNGLLAVDIRVMNQTGYQPLPDYYITFIMPYLNGKYGATYGGKVFSLWQQEAAISKAYLLSDDFCNWTTPTSHTFTELAERLGVSPNSLTGSDGYCDRFRLAKKAGHPLPECCGTHHPMSFTAGKHCKYWITGALEMLSYEGMLSVEESGGRKNHQIKIQVWRSWPVLSPYQIKTYLARSVQEKHKEWLHSPEARRIGVTWKKWTAEQIPSGIEQFADRDVQRECYGQFIRNPFRL